MAEVQAAPDQKAPQQQQPQQQDESGEKKDQPAPRTYSQEELDRIANKIRKNARREARLEAERDFYARQAQPKPEEKKEPAAKEPAEPKREDFDDYETYQRELARYEARTTARAEAKKEADEREKKAREKEQQQSAEKAAQTWNGKIEASAEKHADFEDVLEDNQPTVDLIGRSPMREFITESDIGPEIVYHLCQNPDEAKRIAALPKYKQAAEIAKIEDTLVAAARPKEEKKGDEEDEEDDADAAEHKAAGERNSDGTFKPKKDPSKAPEPIEPVGARSANSSSLPSDKDDPETWRRKELARMRKREGK